MQQPEPVQRRRRVRSKKLPIIPEQLHRNGTPTRDCAPRPTRPYSLRLTKEERARLDEHVRERDEPASVLIRQALVAFGLI